MTSLLDPRVWLAFLLAVILSLGTGGYFGYTYEKRSTETSALKVAVVASESARNKERAGTGAVTTIGDQLTQALSAQKASSDHEISILKAKLATMPATRVGGDVVSLLYASPTPDVPGNTAAGLGTGRAPAFADSTAADQLELAGRNYREVCEPNAEQLKAVQDAYNAIRDKYNVPTK